MVNKSTFFRYKKALFIINFEYANIDKIIN